MIEKRNSGMMAAAAVMAGAVVLFGTVLTRAVMSTPSDAPVAAPVAETVPPESPAPRTSVLHRIPRAELERAAELAPFDPEREAPSGRYQLPGERVVEVVAAAPERPRELPAPPAFQVLGTAASPDGGVAVIRIGDAAPRMVALGQEVEGYRVAEINAARVTMSNADRTLSLSVPSAVPNASAVAAQRGRQGQQARGGGQGNNNNNNARGAAAQGGRGTGPAAPAAAAQLQAERQRLIAEQMMLQMQASGVQGRVQIQSDGDRMIVTGPNGQQQVIGVPGAQFQAGQNRVYTDVRVEAAPNPR